MTRGRDLRDHASAAAGEEDGHDYHFLTEEEFSRGSKREFLEHVVYVSASATGRCGSRRIHAAGRASCSSWRRRARAPFDAEPSA